MKESGQSSLKCVLTMKSSPLLSKKRSGLVYLKIAVSFSKRVSHGALCVCACVATCVVDLFLEAACAG